MTNAGRNFAQRFAFVCALQLLAGCATISDATYDVRLKATQSLDQDWAIYNDATRRTQGTRIVHATPLQVWRASRSAMVRIGLKIDDTASSVPNVVATKFISGGTWPWSQAVREAEQSRVRQALRNVLGKNGVGLLATPGDQTLTGKVIASADLHGGSNAIVDFKSIRSNHCKDQSCPTEIPPSALRAAYFEFWTAFDDELATQVAEEGKRRPTALLPNARHRRAPKATSDWVLPPSGWTPPPK